MEVKELETLELSIKGYKDATDAAIKAVQEELRTTNATAGAAQKMAETLDAQLKEQDKYAREIEKQLKSKTLTPAEQESFNSLLGKALENNWTEIKKFEKARKGFSFTLDEMASKAVSMGLNTSITDGPGAYFTTVIPGIRTLPNRKVHMRQIIPVGTMSTTTLTYMRETGGTGDLAAWAEYAGDSTTEKPQIDRQFQEVTVTAEYIAGWLRVSRKMLDDMSAFRSYLQMRLVEMYLKVEDAQILNGNGVSPNIEGLLEVAVQAVNTTGANIERLVLAIAQLEGSDYTATGIVLHPAAYYNIALNKATGSGEYDLPGIVVIQNGQLYVAGVPVYKTTAIATDTYIVGDFEQGAQLYIREQPTVGFFEEDGNNVTTNRITVRIEGRIALAIYRAEAFVQGTFTGIAPIS
jgi:HK97 family phage major capsid protein